MLNYFSITGKFINYIQDQDSYYIKLESDNQTISINIDKELYNNIYDKIKKDFIIGINGKIEIKNNNQILKAINITILKK